MTQNSSSLEAFLAAADSAIRAGRVQAAREALDQAESLGPDDPRPPFLAATLASGLGDDGTAADRYREALRRAPGFSPARFNLANRLLAIATPEALAEAVTHFAHLAENGPPPGITAAAVAVNHAWTLRAAGNPTAALSVLRAATGADAPADASTARAKSVLGILLQDQGEDAEALETLGAAYVAGARDGETAWRLGRAHLSRGRPEDALDPLRAAVAAEPGIRAFREDLSQALYGQGLWEEADDALARTPDADEDPGFLLRRALMLPLMPADAAAIDALRQRQLSLFARAETLGATGQAPDDALARVGMTNFYLAYHGRNDRAHQQAFSRAVAACWPGTAFEDPTVARRRTRIGRRGRIRLGIVLSYWGNSTMTLLNEGLLAGLDPARFEITAFSPGPAAARPPGIPAGMAVLPLGPDLPSARAAIMAFAPDVLHFVELGMTPQTWFLAFSRLAPVQTVTYGHPDTTGIPTVDAFLSAAPPFESPESPGRDSSYSERLVPLPWLPTRYRRPEPPPALARAAYGLPADKRLYLCPQSLFKVHPDMDAPLAALLRRDPRGRLVLIAEADTPLHRALLARWQRAGMDIDRVILLPRQSRARFLALHRLCDAVLDTFHFSAGNSALEAFAMGVPVVHLPGAHLRGRLTLGYLNTMGLAESAATSPEDYVEKALAHADGNGPADLAARAAVLFERQDAVDGFSEAVAALAADAARL